MPEDNIAKTNDTLVRLEQIGALREEYTLTLADVGRLLLLTKGRIEHYRKTGRLPQALRLGKRLYFRPEDIEAWALETLYGLEDAPLSEALAEGGASKTRRQAARPTADAQAQPHA